MKWMLSVIARATGRTGERVALRAPRRRTNKALVLCGLIAGLMLGGASVARAEVWDFSYSGSGIAASGTITGVLNGAWYDITSVTGSRTEGSVTQSITQFAPMPTCFGCNKYFYTTGALSFAFFIVDTRSFLAGWNSSGDGQEYGPLTCTAGRESCEVLPQGQTLLRVIQGSPPAPHVDAVPEINASAGLEALAVLLVFGLIMREMFLRRRFA